MRLHDSMKLAIINIVFVFIGFHDDSTHNTFGYYKRGVYMPQSNFLFEFITEVISEADPQSSGFLLMVKTEDSDYERYDSKT